MYLIFPPEYEGLADAVFTKAQQSYQYTTKKRESGLVDSVGKGTLVVTTYDRDAAKSEDEVAQYRWSTLEAMALGAVFVHFDDVDEAHFFTPDDELPINYSIFSRFLHTNAPKVLGRPSAPGILELPGC